MNRLRTDGFEPSRHPLSPPRDGREGEISELRNLGEQVKMVIPAFADEFGNWLSSIQIAQSVWGPRPSPDA